MRWLNRWCTFVDMHTFILWIHCRVPHRRSGDELVLHWHAAGFDPAGLLIHLHPCGGLNYTDDTFRLKHLGDSRIQSSLTLLTLLMLTFDMLTFLSLSASPLDVLSDSACANGAVMCKCIHMGSVMHCFILWISASWSENWLISKGSEPSQSSHRNIHSFHLCNSNSSHHFYVTDWSAPVCLFSLLLFSLLLLLSSSALCSSSVFISPLFLPVITLPFSLLFHSAYPSCLRNQWD